MTRFRWSLLTMLVAAAGLLPASEAYAQGTTTAVISGRITDTEGQPLPNIQITVTNLSTGVVRNSISNDQGRYLVPGLPVGGPYTVAASAIGFAASEQENLRLTLGQNLAVDFVLRVQAVALRGIDVLADRAQGQIINPGRTGAEQLVTERQIDNLPTISRNFTDFIQLSPLVGAGGSATSVGAQNNRFNNIQIDGATTQDLFGLGSTGQPGGQAGARSISLEAVQEYQILAAPFDIRQSGFSGGLINAVTKSGTNDLAGSVYAYYNNQDFARDELEVGGDTFTFDEEFTNRILGASLGGPIIRDRAHFFLSAEFEKDERPGGNIAVGREAPTVTGVDPADAQRFADLLAGYGATAGSFGAREDNSPNNNLFGRIDAQLSANHHLTLRHNYVRAEDDVVVNRSTGSNYSFDSNWYFFESTTNSSVLQLNSTFGGLFNEFTAGYTRIRDRRTPNQTFPVVQVNVPNQAGTGTKRLIAGAEYFSQGNELDQDALELTNNLSFTRGNHRITFGAQAQYFKFRNLFQAGKTGEWSFSSLADLEAGTPNFYRRSVPVAGVEDPNARNSVLNASLYAQTEWSGVENLVLTAGLRYDVPLTMGDDPLNNPLVQTEIDRRTDEIASGNGLFSPRLGFNWDVRGDQTTQLRGGAGVFSGRQPYVWISNLYGNTGLATVQISCSGATLPTFTVDPNGQPTACVGAGGSPAPPARPVINLIDPDFKYPQNFRTNIGIDHTLPYGVVATVDFMYTRALNQIFLRELNVDFENPVSTTQGGRPVFGTHTIGPISGSNTNVASPNRISNELAAVVELTNSDQDRSWSITTQAQKRFSAGFDMNASYTYMDAQDVSGLTSSIATSNIGFNPVTGSPNSPILSTSDYETTHKIVLSSTYDVMPWMTVSAFYVGASGDGYSYVYDGDVNADGFEASYASNRFNDLIYVPMNAADITLTDPLDWAELDQFISTEECLDENRGRIIERNACKEPWQNRLDTRFTFRVPTINSQRAEVSLDVINVLNLVNQDWGVIRGMPNATADLLELRGWDAVNNRGIFEPTDFVRLDDDNNANPFTTFTGSSRWRMQLGVRYVF
ncbi:MAG TPA: carboxypeptidase regulatory-like domain-containing protein [Longimicrobiales bacterium]|nr:carboxypeptidase regulatory-like domain-containing protein [Longimicrobiales bacterium]